MELLLFLIGGSVYTLLEVLWKGQSHWTMFLLGGICFVIMGLLNEYKIPWHWCLLRQAVVSACIITVCEFFTGCVVNLWLGWNVWDYSVLRFHFMGQICLVYSAIWFFLCIPGIKLCHVFYQLLFDVPDDLHIGKGSEIHETQVR